jgi:hypothetical protein
LLKCCLKGYANLILLIMVLLLLKWLWRWVFNITNKLVILKRKDLWL